MQSPVVKMEQTLLFCMRWIAVFVHVTLTIMFGSISGSKSLETKSDATRHFTDEYFDRFETTRQ